MTKPSSIGKTLILLFLGFSLLPLEGAAKPPAKGSHDKTLRSNQALAIKAYDQLPAAFEANQGQTARQVKYLSRGAGSTLFLTRNQLVISFQDLSRRPLGAGQAPAHRPGVLRLTFLGANSHTQISGAKKLPGTSNYFVGNDPRQWRTGISTYAEVRYKNAYPGVALVFHGNAHNLEYDLVVAPGASVAAPRLQIEGARQVRLDSQGNLSLRIGSRKMEFLKPQAFQQTCHTGLVCRRTVDVQYDLVTKDEVRFKVGNFNHRLPLLIDPVLDYSTYLGGSGSDTANGIAVDSSGNAYIVGTAGSADFPTKNPYQSNSGGGTGDVFVAKLSADLSQLIYSTYLGGYGDDFGTGIALDSSGDAYITGSTTSSNFPTTSAAFQSSYGGNNGNSEAFVAELSQNGGTLLGSSYLGGNGPDFGNAIAVSSSSDACSGNAYVAGSTQSNNFPTASPYQAGYDGSGDAFVTEVNFTNTGSSCSASSASVSLVYSTYLGGNSADIAQAIAVDSSGNAYAAGYTYSSNFPTANPLFQTNPGSASAFVTELNAAGSKLLFSTYLGGSGLDRAFGITLDASGNIYVAGDTTSADLPVSGGAAQGANHGNGDAFAAKLGTDGSTLVYLTYLGGAEADRATAVAADSAGNAYITGFTFSDDFPTVQPLQPNLGGGTCSNVTCSDAFVSEINAQGSALVYSTYLGGNNADFGQAIAAGPSGDIYVAGTTASSNFPAIAGAEQGNNASTSSGTNAFITEVGPYNSPALAMIPQKIDFGQEGLEVKSSPQTVTVTNAGSSALYIGTITPPSDGIFRETDDCAGKTLQSGNSCAINITYTPTSTGTITDEISVNDDAAGTPQQITVTGTGVSTLASVSLSPSSLTFAGQKIGTTSLPQVVTLQNTGTEQLDISSITANSGSDFAITNNNCGSTLAAGAKCTFSVTFTPTATGTQTGTVTVADNISTSGQTVSLTGTGTAVYSLSASADSSTILIGQSSTTFTIQATGPSTFSESINLSCSSATCSFSPSSIEIGQSSTVTVSGLSATTSNPLDFTVTGTSSSTSQTASLPLTVFLSDFSLSATPPLYTVTTAGNSATYTVSVAPIDGFNQAVVLSCSSTGLPQDASCSFSPASVAPTVPSAVTSTLTITTTAQSSSLLPTGKQPLFPGGREPPLIWGLLAWLLFAGLAGWKIFHASPEAQALPRKRAALAVGGLFGVVLLASLLAGCGPSNPVSGTGSGTQAGTYTIVIQGTLGTNSGVTRDTTVNLTVD